MIEIKFKGNGGDLQASFLSQDKKQATRKALKDANKLELKGYISNMMSNPKNFSFMNKLFDNTIDELIEFVEADKEKPKKIAKPNPTKTEE